MIKYSTFNNLIILIILLLLVSSSWQSLIYPWHSNFLPVNYFKTNSNIIHLSVNMTHKVYYSYSKTEAHEKFYNNYTLNTYKKVKHKPRKSKSNKSTTKTDWLSLL